MSSISHRGKELREKYENAGDASASINPVTMADLQVLSDCVNTTLQLDQVLNEIRDRLKQVVQEVQRLLENIC